MNVLDGAAPEHEKSIFTSAELPSGYSHDSNQEEDLVTEQELLDDAKACVTSAQTAGLSKKKSQMMKSYRAYNNLHPDNSKYKSPQYSARAKNFVPKTRSAVTKNMVAAATALFSTDDVVSVRAENDANDYQQASADMIRELLNIRLDRTNYKGGLPWFPKCMKAVQDANIAGFCVSKQYWEYEIELDTYEFDFGDEGEGDAPMAKPLVQERAAGPTLPPNAVPPTDGAAPAAPAPAPVAPQPPLGGDSGAAEAIPETGDQNLPSGDDGTKRTYKNERIIRDRAFIDLIAPENVIPDMAAPDDDVVQGGMYWIVQYPMHVGDVRSMMKEGHQFMGGGAWREIPEDVMKDAISDYNNKGVRSSRGQGTDRLDQSNIPNVTDYDIVWVHENFIRKGSKDYHFWTLGTKKLLSTPRETIESYPALRGERPYVMGVGTIEAHNVLPMSQVESWSPLQDEINDVRNLTLDTMRQSIAPMTLIRRGANVDLRQVRERGPDATVLVGDVEKDLAFVHAPEATSMAFAQQDRIAVEMDELAGNFSTSSVQQNHNLNETATGMKLMSGASSGKTEFDLRIFVETWVEPVLRQIVWLLQYYETDDTLISLAGEKAKLWQRFGIDPMLDDLLEEQVTVRVNVGIGAADPMQKLAKLQQALTMIGGIAATGAFAGQITIKAEPLCDEILGLAGYQEANRFIDFKSPEEAKAEAGQQVPPEIQVKMRELDIKEKALQADMQQAVADNDTAKAIAIGNNQTQIQVERMKLQGGMQQKTMDLRHDAIMTDRNAQHAQRAGMQQNQFQQARDGQQLQAKSKIEQERDNRRAGAQAERDKRQSGFQADRERRTAGLQGAKDGHGFAGQQQMAQAQMQARQASEQARMQAQAKMQQAKMQQQAKQQAARPAAQ